MECEALKFEIYDLKIVVLYDENMENFLQNYEAIEAWYSEQESR